MGTDALNARRLNVDRFYTGLSIGINPNQGLIGDQILPILRQDLSKVDIVSFGTEAWRIIEDLVGDFSMPERVDIKADKISLEVDGHALMNPISDRQAKESIQGPAKLNLETRALYVLKRRMLLRREKMQADLVTATGSYTASHKADLNGLGTQWDTAVDPLDAIIPALESTVPDDSGERPNTFFAGGEVWAKIIVNAAVKNRVFGTANSQGVPTAAQFAALIGVEKVLIGRAMSRTAAGGSTKLWGKNAGLIYVPPVTGEEIPAFGYTVEQNVFGQSSEAVIRIRNDYMGGSGGYDFKRSHFYTPSITFQNAGYLFYNVVS